MFKVLIVDDEPLFREYLRTIFNWESYGFVLCGEARNGLEALQIAEQTFPHLALIDINMPLMDGMELSRLLKEAYPDIAIVMVTGNGEFQYARQAIRIGVEDYILKPFNPDELFMTLVKMKSKLQKTMEAHRVSRDQSQWLKEQFLNMLVSGDISCQDEEAAEQLERFGMPRSSDRYVVIAVEIDRLYLNWTDSREIGLWKSTVANVLDELLGEQSQCVVFFGPEDHIVSLVRLGPEEEEVPLGIREGLQRLCDMVKRHFKFTATVGIGLPRLHIGEIRASYLEALGALQRKITAGTGGVLVYEQSDATTHGFYSSEINEKMMLALRMSDEVQIKELLDEVFAYVLQQRLSADMTYVLVIGLVSICLSHIVASGKEIADVLGADFSPYQEIKRQEDLDTAYVWLKRIMERTLGVNEEANRPSRSRTIFEEAKLLIDQSYSDPALSVEQITKRLYMNGSYLRKIFQREAAMSISDYITHVRMQRARELLLRKQATITAISEKVGYNDPGYFSKCFKKYFGVAPSDYEGMSEKGAIIPNESSDSFM